MLVRTPFLNTKDIQDPVLRKNFELLESYFRGQNQLLDFQFFEAIFTRAETNRRIKHSLGYTPRDVLVSRLTGEGTVRFNLGRFTDNEIFLTATGPLKVRFYVGAKDATENEPDPEDYQSFTANPGTGEAGEDGQDGTDGAPGSAGADGTDGADGVGGLSWAPGDSDAPAESFTNGLRFFDFSIGGAQYVYAWLTVPASYVAGSQITLSDLVFLTDQTSGDVNFRTTTYLVEPGSTVLTGALTGHTDDINTTISGSAGLARSIGPFELTDATGQINSVAVAANDKLLIRLERRIAGESGGSSNGDARVVAGSGLPGF